ncbi:hypothetical protein NE236_36835 [Actinoallomurus purpureus]|uniref:hypothetical protein n=1 Tax=Actinoallomurus purpureus TaxID=478114 RepID=UPI0020927635|nr:hypothetical protein [Actinoallomurus purpureus]MCO6010539.1 hypothetical protein [Actinoallomurus purpureus]
MIAGIRHLVGIEPAGPVRPPIRRPVVTDPSPQDLAAVQAACRDWAVMWSRWRRAYTAFATFTAGPLIVDEPDPARLLQRCREVRYAVAHGQALIE